MMWSGQGGNETIRDNKNKMKFNTLSQKTSRMLEQNGKLNDTEKLGINNKLKKKRMLK